MNSRTKGKAGELELARLLREAGYEAKRGQQFRGGGDSPDVIGLPGFHVECKRVERLNIHEAMDQARRDRDVSATPIVVHRTNADRRRDTCRGEWLVTISLADFLKLLGAPDACF
jgi:hypothetical protein